MSLASSSLLLDDPRDALFGGPFGRFSPRPRDARRVSPTSRSGDPPARRGPRGVGHERVDGRDPAPPPMGEPARWAPLPRRGKGDDSRSGVLPSPPRRAPPPDAWGSLVPARVGTYGRDIRGRLGKARLVTARSSRPLPVPARLEDDGDPRSRCANDRDDPSAGAAPVPVSFGFHPYVGLPDVPRGAWTSAAPGHEAPRSRRERHPDRRGDRGSPSVDAPLGDRAYDDGFAFVGGRPRRFPSKGGGRRVDCGIPLRIRVGAGFLAPPGIRDSLPSSR